MLRKSLGVIIADSPSPMGLPDGPRQIVEARKRPSSINRCPHVFCEHLSPHRAASGKASPFSELVLAVDTHPGDMRGSALFGEA
jgi:hypothetical protein